MQRYKLIIAYRGTHYHGWQTQPALPNFTGLRPPKGQGLPTIQETLERCLSNVVGEKITLVGSSRTDTGVHAKGQLAHFDTTMTTIPGDKLRRAVNHKLPGDILLLKADRVPFTFHSILTTRRKRYQYSIWNSHNRSVFANDLSWHRWQLLDVDAMRDAANRLVGTHDFASFARPGHGRESTVRTLFSVDISCRLPRIVISIEGDGFLWNMVRIIVGTLVQVGMGNIRADAFDEMLAACDRKAAGPTAPPHGLYLQWIQWESLHPADPRATERSASSRALGANERAGSPARDDADDDPGAEADRIAIGSNICTPPTANAGDLTLSADEAGAVAPRSGPPMIPEPDPRMMALKESTYDIPEHHPQRRHVIAMVSEESILDPVALDPADAVPEDSHGEP